MKNLCFLFVSKRDYNLFYLLIESMCLLILSLIITTPGWAQNNTSGTNGSQNYYSKNINGKWKQTGLNNKTVRSLAISGNNIFAGTYESGVYLSTDNGTTWKQIGLNNKTVRTFAISGNNIFAGTSEYGIYLSTNYGSTWKKTDLDDETVNSLAISGNKLFAGTVTGGFLSTDNGISWKRCLGWGFSSFGYVYSFVISGNNIFASMYHGKCSFNHSNNLGEDWTEYELRTCLDELVISGNNIFAGTWENGIYLSTNNGTSWNQTGLRNKTIYSLAISGNNSEDSGQVIFAGTNDSGVYLSTNNGDNWTKNGLNKKVVLSLAINGDYIFAGTVDNGVFISQISFESEKEFEKFKEKAEIYRNLNPKPEISEEIRKYVIQATELTKNKKYEEAIDMYEKIFELDETFPDAHFNIALILGQMEDYESAILEMKKYLMLVPDAKDARAAQDLIYEWEVNIEK